MTLSSPPDSPVFVSSDAAKAVFQWPAGVRAIQAVYGHAFTAAATPPRVVARDAGAWLRALPAMPPGARYFGAKVMAMSTAAERPGAQYVTLLFDRQTSRLAAFIDAATVTGFRTAATSAAALDKMIAPAPVRLGVIGSGLEASMHVRAFAAIRQLDEVAVYSPTPARREAFAQALTQELGVACRAVAEPQDAAAGATVVLAAARSRGEKPTLYAEWLSPGAAVVSIGSTLPEQREVDVGVVAQSDFIVCDTVDEVLEQTGDMLEAHKAGIALRHKAFSMNELMRGDLAARAAAARLPLFKSVGGGLQDVVIAELILTQALASGRATALPIQFESKYRS